MINKEVFTKVKSLIPKEAKAAIELIPAEIKGKHFEGDTDYKLNIFLEALILHLRGASEKNPTPFKDVSKEFDSNLILKKLRIAFELQAEDLDVIFLNAGLDLSKHEISALFRSSTHKHFKICDEKTFEGFLKGLKISVIAAKNTKG